MHEPRRHKGNNSWEHRGGRRFFLCDFVPPDRGRGHALWLVLCPGNTFTKSEGFCRGGSRTAPTTAGQRHVWQSPIPVCCRRQLAKVFMGHDISESLACFGDCPRSAEASRRSHFHARHAVVRINSHLHLRGLQEMSSPYYACFYGPSIY